LRSQPRYPRQQPAPQARHGTRRRVDDPHGARPRLRAREPLMTRLYLRIFLVFWAVAAVTLAITAILNRATLRAEIDRGRVETLRSSLDALAAQAERALADGGEAGLRRWLEAETRA